MMSSFSDPLEALFAMQRALDARRESDWMGSGTAGMGSYPPINIFQQGDDFVAIIELSGVDRKDLEIEAKENTIRISGKKAVNSEQGTSVHRRERVSGIFDRRFRCQFRSIRTASEPNTTMACSRSLSPGPKATSRGP
jgi:HSP20 family protein